MTTVLKVEHLSKEYLIRHEHAPTYQTFSEEFVGYGRAVISRIFTRRSDHAVEQHEMFTALDNLSFTLGEGEKLGIIGGNGAGKSTLLKLIGRITEPTRGKISVKGRIASLLEVGTGFHPELTARENIFLNGAVMGMTRREIAARFDEIVDFAGVEKFLDTPVKRFSSGMYVRLAFSVAAHLEAEILVIDEVLSVGDAQFQSKCLGKLGDSSSADRTVLFVSHNMQAVKQLCDNYMHIDQGKLVNFGDDEAIISEYLSSFQNTDGARETTTSIIAQLPDDPDFELLDVGLSQNQHSVENMVENGKDLIIAVDYRVKSVTSGLRIYIDLVDEYDTLLFRSFHDEDNDSIPIVGEGQYRSVAVIPANLLAPSSYTLKVSATIFNQRSLLPFPIEFPISVDRTGTANRAYLGDPIRGKLAPVIDWKTSDRHENFHR